MSAFALGATAAGLAVGAALGELGALAIPASVSGRARLAVLLGALLVALVLDAAPGDVPSPGRQVNHRWLDQFRGWVYGLGYGAQLGLAITTVVSSAATYAALLAALLSGSTPAGAAIIGGYGAVRGLTPLATARVRTTRQLVAVTAALERWRRASRHGAQAALLIASLAALIGCLG